MATLQKIRSKGPLLVIVIGLALFAFIAEEAMRSIQSASNESKQQVGEVFGEKISVQEYQNLVDEWAEIQKFNNGGASLTDAQLTQLRDQVWNIYLTNKLIEHEAEELGLTVTEAEVKDIITSGKSQWLMQSPFRNQQTGRFDVTSYNKFLTEYKQMKANPSQASAQYMEYYENIHTIMLFIEKNIRTEALGNKYQALLAKSILSNSTLNKAAFEARTNESDVVIAALPYSTIKDEEVKVEDSDLKAKYNELKERFKQQAESRDIKYIDVEVKASDDDKAALDKDMAETASLLAEGGNIAKIVRESGSTVSYSPIPVSKKALPSDIARELDSMSVGQLKAPYLYRGDNTMNIIKLMGKVTAADSIELRQIQVAGVEAETVQKTADSIMIALNQGIPFDSVAKKYSQTGEKHWIASAHYEGATLDEENLNFIKTIQEMPAGSIRKVDFTQGSVVVQVTDKRNYITKYDVAVVKCPIEFSKETYEKVSNDFSQFVASNPTQQDMEANALKSGYTLQERKNLFNYEHYVGGVSNTRDALRWIFNEDTKVGSVSPLYDCGDNNHLMVVVLTGVHEKGYLKMEDVKDYLTQEVLKDKKAALLKEKLANAKSIADIMKQPGAVTDTLKHVTFSAPAFVMKTGASEPMVSAVAATTAQGKFASPVKGNAAVYGLQVIAKNKTAEKYDEKQEARQQEALYQRSVSRFMNDLYEKADVVDNRYLFF